MDTDGPGFTPPINPNNPTQITIQTPTAKQPPKPNKHLLDLLAQSAPDP